MRIHIWDAHTRMGQHFTPYEHDQLAIYISVITDFILAGYK